MTPRNRIRASLLAGPIFMVLLAFGIIVALVFVWTVFQPAPPHRVVIAGGAPGGEYDRYAHQYADFFAKNGFELVVKQTAGAVENYRLLLDENSDVRVALVQGGTAPDPSQCEDLRAICSVYLEPLWVFYRDGQTITRLSELSGKRLAIGKLDSGARALAIKLLADNGISPDKPGATQLLDLSGQQAADALVANKVDAIFLVIAPEAPVIQQLMRTPGIRLMSFPQADGYTRRFSFLSHVTLYRGVLDPGADRPAQDIELLAPTAALVGVDDLHHGIVELLVMAARAAHSGGNYLSPAGAFPSERFTEIPLSNDARYYLRATPSRWSQLLPFWLKSLVDRLLYLVIPLIALLVPLIRIAPAIYRWSVRRKITRWYAKLRALEATVAADTPDVLNQKLDVLSSYETALSEASLPRGFMPDLYELRMHLDRARQVIRTRLAKRED
jgi:TRAP transporter TAXI family solute receptor